MAGIFYCSECTALLFLLIPQKWKSPKQYSNFLNFPLALSCPLPNVHTSDPTNKFLPASKSISPDYGKNTLQYQAFTSKRLRGYAAEIAVTLDPRKLRDAVAYRFFLSFLDFCVRRDWFTEEEAVPYRTGAEEVFDPKPVPDKPLRRMEQTEIFREIMEALIKEYSDKIAPIGQPFVKAAKSFGAYREIGGFDERLPVI